jgi:hypothetical protein
MTLTVDDLRATLEDERHQGWGYACCDALPYGTRGRLDRAVVEVANELGLTADDLLAWSNSKYGRWLYDAVYGTGREPNRETVRELLSLKALERLAAEGESISVVAEAQS